MRMLHLSIREYLRRLMISQDPATLAAVGAEEGGDTQYRIDLNVENLLLDLCREWAEETPFVLIAEGIVEDGWYALPEGSNPQEADFLLIVDPIDGTRQLMYDKRSAWLLSAIAPNFGRETTLEHICMAMQTELPTTRHLQAHHLWAIKGQGAKAELHNLVASTVQNTHLQPSRAETLEHGFASFVKFFPEGKQVITELEMKFLARVIDESINPLVFEDQYTSTGGQLFELMCGHDRFIADLRPWAFQKMGLRNSPLACHPYDICTALIAEELGVIVTDLKGRSLCTPLDIRKSVGWIGYANKRLQEKLEPILMELLKGVQ
jgi:hypothetical protein